jgi:hypothetical protein
LTNTETGWSANLLHEPDVDAFALVPLTSLKEKNGFPRFFGYGSQHIIPHQLSPNPDKPEPKKTIMDKCTS